MPRSYDIKSRSGLALLLLRLGVTCCFFGWAWQHLVWSVPYGEVLWNPDYFGWLADANGVSWEAYVAEVATDTRIRLATRLLGTVYLCLALLAVMVPPGRWWGQALLAIGALLLGVIAFAKYVNAGHAAAMLVEYGGQVLSPLVLALALRCGARAKWPVGIAVLGFCCTFIGHGVYALGLVTTPGHYYGMVHTITGLGAEGATTFLLVAGILDVVVCVGLLIPRLRAPCLIYAALWGLATALARPLSGGILESAHEAVLRAPHFALPLYLLVVLLPRKLDVREG